MSDREELAKLIAETQNVPFPGPKQNRMADAILTSDWLARVKREAASEALNEAAKLIRHKQHPESVRQMLTRLAAAYRDPTS